MCESGDSTQLSRVTTRVHEYEGSRDRIRHLHTTSSASVSHTIVSASVSVRLYRAVKVQSKVVSGLVPGCSLGHNSEPQLSCHGPQRTRAGAGAFDVRQ